MTGRLSVHDVLVAVLEDEPPMPDLVPGAVATGRRRALGRRLAVVGVAAASAAAIGVAVVTSGGPAGLRGHVPAVSPSVPGPPATAADPTPPPSTRAAVPPLVFLAEGVAAAVTSALPVGATVDELEPVRSDDPGQQRVWSYAGVWADDEGRSELSVTIVRRPAGTPAPLCDDEFKTDCSEPQLDDGSAARVYTSIFPDDGPETVSSVELQRADGYLVSVSSGNYGRFLHTFETDPPATTTDPARPAPMLDREQVLALARAVAALPEVTGDLLVVTPAP